LTEQLEPSGEQLVIRQVTPADLDACFTVEATCFPPEEAAARETIALRIDQFPQGFLVAELDRLVIGHINSGATNQDDITAEEFKQLIGHEADGRNIVVFSLAVLPDYQRQGIAAALMEQFVERSRALGKERVLLLCKSELIRYYEKLGFRYVAQSLSSHGGAAWHEMAYDL
jgi:ribosomal protein S18 acetylase RimI-like enzyme